METHFGDSISWSTVLSPPFAHPMVEIRALVIGSAKVIHALVGQKPEKVDGKTPEISQERL